MKGYVTDRLVSIFVASFHHSFKLHPPPERCKEVKLVLESASRPLAERCYMCVMVYGCFFG